MAALAVIPVMNGDSPIHPFFAKAHTEQVSTTTPFGENGNSTKTTQGPIPFQSQPQTKIDAKKRKGISVLDGAQKTLQEIVNPGSTLKQNVNGEVAEHISETIGCDMQNVHARKRRKGSPNVPVDVDVLASSSPLPTMPTMPGGASSPQVIVPASSPLLSGPICSVEATITPPKKMLRLNARGKFSSPISRTPSKDTITATPGKRRGRPRATSRKEQVSKLIVAVKYTTRDAQVGARIDRILNGEETVELDIKKSSPGKTRRKVPGKPPHPFFTGKNTEERSVPKPPSPRKPSAVTPGKLRRQTLGGDGRQVHAEAVEVWTSTLLKDRFVFKHPGAKEPVWPTKEQAHVRQLEDTATKLHINCAISLPRRKQKTSQMPFPVDESIVERVRCELIPEQTGALRPDGFHDPHPDLRLPLKLLLPGTKITHIVTKELISDVRTQDQEGSSFVSSSQAALHPALRRLHDALPTSSSSFDELRGEPYGWAQKYAPATSAEILQPSREIAVLKTWLIASTTNAVVNSQPGILPLLQSDPKHQKKRRRKVDGLDDFLVDDDEIIHDMDELTDPDDEPLRSHSAKGANSVIQSTLEGAKFSNAVLLSGPHGCGKTAAAYAVAKELGFKVFEIGSSERRSGKDVLDKVGDMAGNHLVKHHGVKQREVDLGELSAAEEHDKRNEEACQRDVVSGRQGKMSAFFKPALKKNKHEPLKTTASKSKILENVQKVTQKRPKDQQQSLILLEEVDILFKEDKDFWQTVFRLIAVSKRPFIMTCNDENLVPIQALTFHAILRFLPPPPDLATDYLLLLAATEGHLLRRDEVASIYKWKKCDLRASIMELDFWCQMSVGDCRSGLQWIYQRFPEGADLDEIGRKLRVISEGTYKQGMGWMATPALDTVSKLTFGWREHDIDPPDLLGWRDLPSLDVELPSLRDFATFADALSAADVYSDYTNNASPDTTQSLMREKSRGHYIEGLPLLQTDERPDFTQLASEMAAISTLAAFQNAALLQTGDAIPDVQATFLNRRVDMSQNLARRDFACFDAISSPSESALSTGPGIVQSAFDGPLATITTDVAPYVRSIVQFDLMLAEQRERLNLIMNDGRAAKHARTTRAARSALEGSQRASTRRERWFTEALDLEAVLATGGQSWPKTGVSVTDVASTVNSEASASQESKIES